MSIVTFGVEILDGFGVGRSDLLFQCSGMAGRIGRKGAGLDAGVTRRDFLIFDVPVLPKPPLSRSVESRSEMNSVFG